MTAEAEPEEGPDLDEAPEGAAAEDLRWLTVTPPEGAPWDLPCPETPWVFLDCEMTGVDASRDEIIEVAAVRTRGGREEASLSTLLRAGVESSPEALAAHGIDDAMLRDAPSFGDIGEELALLLDGAVPVLHGAAMDRVFLNQAFEAHGLDARLRQVVDTVHLARRAVLSNSYKLGVIAERLGVAPRQWHRAHEDVQAIRGVFERVSALLSPTSARDLWQVRAGVRLPTQVRDTVAVALSRRDGRPVAIWLRQPGRAPRRVIGRIIRWEPPHLTLGLGASGRHRGVSIIRADRVLRVEPVA
ncbi:MAG: 3'-5' exonuclease [Polyangiales bacterium]